MPIGKVGVGCKKLAIIDLGGFKKTFETVFGEKRNVFLGGRDGNIVICFLLPFLLCRWHSVQKVS